MEKFEVGSCPKHIIAKNKESGEVFDFVAVCQGYRNIKTKKFLQEKIIRRDYEILEEEYL